ncbi:MAG TPA: hypothetical protein VE242_09930, partial [Chthoniobacterales bacterium]|nr:hypothetical protein [Chthoniobacterales bacterium]
ATSEDLAFVMPWTKATSEDLAFLTPWNKATVSICDAGLGVDFEKFAMLPLGAETGRHIRGSDERNSASDAAKDQQQRPVARVADDFGAGYAMLPLGTETGRHIRNLDEDNKQPEKTVATNAGKVTA